MSSGSVLTETGEALGLGIAGAVQILYPLRVVLAGRLANSESCKILGAAASSFFYR